MSAGGGAAANALAALETIPAQPTKAAQVRDRLRALIESGRLAPGARVNADAIARALGVSKIPVREAISQLEAQGLVVVTPHVGARVATRSARDLRGVYLVRAALEPLAARLAAGAITPGGLAALERLAAEMESALERGALESLSDANRAFHTGVARAAGYGPIAETVEETLRRVIPYRSPGRERPHYWRSVMEEHRRILDGLRRGDAEGAERAAREHVERRLEGDLDAETEVP